MTELEVKKDGSVYIQPYNIMVDNQMTAHDLIARHHPMKAVNNTILCNPGIYPIPDLKWEAVYQFYDEIWEDCNSIFYEELKSLGDTKNIRQFAILKPSNELNKWISVNERLPEQGQNVICIQDPTTTATRKPLFATFNGKKFEPPHYHHLPGDRVTASTWCDIIYWQPLPEPPVGSPPKLR